MDALYLAVAQASSVPWWANFPEGVTSHWEGELPDAEPVFPHRNEIPSGQLQLLDFTDTWCHFWSHGAARPHEVRTCRPHRTDLGPAPQRGDVQYRVTLFLEGPRPPQISVRMGTWVWRPLRCGPCRQHPPHPGAWKSPGSRPSWASRVPRAR